MPWQIRRRSCECVHALVLASHDRMGSNCAGKHAVLRVILKVTAGKCRAVNVHSRCIPAGNTHIVCHLADGFAEGIGQIGVPGCCDHHSRREADGALLGKVVVDGGRAVTVDGLNLAHGGNGNGLVAAQGPKNRLAAASQWLMRVFRTSRRRS